MLVIAVSGRANRAPAGAGNKQAQRKPARASKGFGGKWKTLILSGLILCGCAEGQKNSLSIEQRKELDRFKGRLSVWSGKKG